MMTFVITAKFVKMSIRSAQKSADCAFFHLKSYIILSEHVLDICKNRLTEAILTNTQNV